MLATSMRSYFAYYVAWAVAAYVLGSPVALLGAVVFFLLRGRIPDPSTLVRRRRYAQSLVQRMAVNPGDTTARRELGRVYLEACRPKRALEVLQHAPSNTAADPELDFLLGLALHRSGRHEEALEPLVRSVADRAIRYGEPYLVAGDALRALGRLDEALDAYERYADINHSDARVRFALARVHHARGERDETSAAIRAALAALSGTRRRGRLWLWLEGQWLRAVFLRDATVIAVGLGSIALSLAVGSYAIDFAPRGYAYARGAVMRGTWWAFFGDEGFQDGEAASPMFEAMARCGTQSTRPIRRGEYEPVPSSSDAGMAGDHERVSKVVIGDQSVEVYGREPRALCLTRVRTRTASSLVSDVAIFIGNEGDEDDVILGSLTLEQHGDRVHFRFRWADASPSAPGFELLLRPRD